MTSLTKLSVAIESLLTDEERHDTFPSDSLFAAAMSDINDTTRAIQKVALEGMLVSQGIIAVDRVAVATESHRRLSKDTLGVTLAALEGPMGTFRKVGIEVPSVSLESHTASQSHHVAVESAKDIARKAVKMIADLIEWVTKTVSRLLSRTVEAINSLHTSFKKLKAPTNAEFPVQVTLNRSHSPVMVGGTVSVANFSKTDARCIALLQRAATLDNATMAKLSAEKFEHGGGSPIEPYLLEYSEGLIKIGKEGIYGDPEFTHATDSVKLTPSPKEPTGTLELTSASDWNDLTNVDAIIRGIKSTRKEVEVMNSKLKQFSKSMIDSDEDLVNLRAQAIKQYILYRSATIASLSNYIVRTLRTRLALAKALSASTGAKA